MEATISEKFCNLLDQLLYTKAEFETVADEVADSRLRTALNGFSEESDIYINELCSHLKLLGFQYEYPRALTIPETLIITAEIIPDNTIGNELHYLCDTSERHITSTYSDILNAPFPFPVIREIMMYQLNTLKSLLEKIHFLNFARFSS